MSRIIRFLTLEKALLLFGCISAPTFCLNSYWYYKILEDGKIGDKNENDFVQENYHGKNGDQRFISCWAILESKEIPEQYWKEFGGSPIAIISSREGVKFFLEKHLQPLVKHGFWNWNNGS